MPTTKRIVQSVILWEELNVEWKCELQIDVAIATCGLENYKPYYDE